MNSTTELIITILFGWSGAHRFIRKENEIGILYLFTFGFFTIGWIIDIISCIYYMTEKFTNLKNSIKENTLKCNELNEHIEELKNAYVDIKMIDYGNANFVDNSVYNFKRPELKKYREQKNVYSCSSTVCKNAKDQPFKYICKYFNIKSDEETLDNFEKILNDFAAAEQGKNLLKKERDEIITSISEKIPFYIKIFDKKHLIRKLGFTDIDFSQLYFPKYIFRYVSAGGNSSTSCQVVFDIGNLERFVSYLSQIVKFKRSVAGQRSLMTISLREEIKRRDNYTCQQCGISTNEEPNLLLEIDHRIPLSKGGMSEKENLQTLCWKCNRSKGSKLK